MTTPIVPILDSANNLKRCTKCGMEYPATTEYFHRDGTRLRASCKACANAKTRAWYAENADYARDWARKYLESHREEARAYHKRHYRENAEQLRADKRARRAADPEKFREINRRAWEKHKEKRNAEQRAAYRLNPEKSREYNRAYYAAHKDELNAKSREWYAVNHERMREYERGRAESRKDYKREYNRAYYKTERGQNSMTAYKHRRRAKIRNGKCIGADLVTIRAAQTDKQGRLICWACGKPIAGVPHLDHWIPLDKGGAHDAGNLHYMHARCNLSKGSKHPTELGRLI